MTMDKYVKNYILSVTNTVMMLLFPIITYPYVLRILGPTNIGIINFTQSYGYYFIHMASFGMNSYAIREVSKVRDNEKKVEQVSNELFNINMFFSALSTVLYFCGVFVVRNFRDNFQIFAIYSVVILSNFLSLDWLLQSFEDYFFSTIRNLIIRVLAVICVFVLINQAEDYAIYMVIICIVEMGTKIPTLFYSRKNYAKLRVDIKFLNFGDHIKSMFTLFTFRLVNGISSNIDKLMIGFMMVYANVGIYSAGVKFVLMLSPIVETVGIIMFPKINIAAGISAEDYMKNLKINYDMILFMGIPMSVGMFLVSGRLIPLLAGGQYTDAVVVSRIMSAIILLGPIGDLLGSKTLLVYKKDKWLLYCSSIVAISNIILNLIFIPVWGINGAAGASAICCVIGVLTRYAFSRRIVPIRLLSVSVLKYCLFVLPFIVIYTIFKSLIDTNTIYMLLFIVFCCFVYLIELMFSKDYILGMILKKIGIKRIILETENKT